MRILLPLLAGLVACGFGSTSPEQDRALEEDLAGQWRFEEESRLIGLSLHAGGVYSQATWTNGQLDGYSEGSWRVTHGRLVRSPSHACTPDGIGGWQQTPGIVAAEHKISLNEPTLRVKTATRNLLYQRGDFEEVASPCCK